MKRALITGVTGFVGGAVARCFHDAGWEVHGVVRQKMEASQGVEYTHLYDGSLASLQAAFAAARPDVVIHIASMVLTEHRPEQIPDLLAANVMFPCLLAEALSLSGCRRLVNTGTSWQHYHSLEYSPVNLYAATKQAAEDVLRYYAEARELSCITLKLFDNYGPNDTRKKLLNLMLDVARSGSSLDMTPGEQIIDLTHVDDLAAAYLQAAHLLLQTDSTLLETYFVSGERFKVREIVEQFEVVTGTPLLVQLGARDYRPREVMAPVDVSGRVLPGWAPERRFVKYFGRSK